MKGILMTHSSLSAYAGVAVRDVMRPKAVGKTLDAHTYRVRKELEPDVERMRRAVCGEEGARVHKKDENVRKES